MMRSLVPVLFSFTSLAACAGLDGEDDTLAESVSELSVTSWSSYDDHVSDDFGYPPASAMFQGKEYYVYTWGDSAFPTTPHDLYWHRCDGTSCTGRKRVSGQATSDRVNLAAFNGYLYMTHVGESDSSAIWFSRFDPATEQWSENVKLSQTTFDGPPAMAAFDNKLYLVGNSERTITRRGVEVTTYPMWFVTMSPSEVFSPTMSVGKESVFRPSLTEFFGRLYLAHQDGRTAQLAVNTLMPGSTSWSANTTLKNGTVPIQGENVQIAAVNGFLHLVYSRFSDDYTYWMYNDGCKWSTDITIDSRSTSSRLSMSNGLTGLLLSRMYDTGLWPYTHLNWIMTRFNAPPAPITVPLCLPTQG